MSTFEDPGYYVEQAERIVSLQAECTLDEALVLMMERASVQRMTLTEIADAVLGGSSGSGLSRTESCVRPLVRRPHPR